uniref:Uncharacterized protein K02A2.6 n=1 Tax=Schistocephalus solidus TaxID=70667 RepID=A0A0X3NU25_SCHSO
MPRGRCRRSWLERWTSVQRIAGSILGKSEKACSSDEEEEKDKNKKNNKRRTLSKLRVSPPMAVLKESGEGHGAGTSIKALGTFSTLAAIFNAVGLSVCHCFHF